MIVVALGTCTSAYAQCAFDRPTANQSARTGDYRSVLVPAFVSCGNPGGNTPNNTSQGGIPSCSPPETFQQQSGSPPNAWRFSQVPGDSWGRVRLNRQAGSYNNPAGIRDLRIRLWLRKIIDTAGPASGVGVLALVLRSTFNDPVNGDMTISDFPIDVPFTLTSGNTTFTTTLAAVLTSISLPRFPDCTIHEVLSVTVRDENSDHFAVPGVRIIP
jgi:hypothetical protein